MATNIRKIARRWLYIHFMAHRPLYGQLALRTRLTSAWLDGRLPASLLFSGPRGVGKQRLALWLGQLLLCEQPVASEPCGECQHCRYALRGVHPDLRWFFPRPRLKESDPAPDDIAADIAEAVAERMAADGLWTPPAGSEGIYVATTRAIVARSSARPAMAKRAVFVIGDAERMVSQEGADQAANAFLKLLEEPPPGTTIILTTSEPGALLATIRSRVVSVRVPPLRRADMDAFLDDVAVQRRFPVRPPDEAMRAGAPGELLAGGASDASVSAAHRLLAAALAPASPAGAAERARVAMSQGAAGARGGFTDTLEALTQLLHGRAHQLVIAGHNAAARRAAAAVVIVETAKIRAQGNVSPQLLGARVVALLHRTLRT